MHNDNFYSFPNTATTKSRRIGLLGHAAHVGETLFRYERLKERECLEDINVDGSITLIWISKTQNSKGLTGVALYDQVTGSYKRGNEPQFPKCEDFLDQLYNKQFLKRDVLHENQLVSHLITQSVSQFVRLLINQQVSSVSRLVSYLFSLVSQSVIQLINQRVIYQSVS